MTTCVVLFSGGIDSTTALYWARRRYDKTTALIFDYGQRQRAEIRLARRHLRLLEIEHQLLKVDLRPIGGSALTDRAAPIPRYRAAADLPAGPPPTYVPFRNGIFLALAAAWAEVRGISDIVCGFHVLDSPDYPDTRRDFVAAMEEAINLGNRAAFGGDRIHILAPFQDMTKADILRVGRSIDADYSYSISCYADDEVPCGTCASCRLRAKAWEEIGAEDPLLTRLRGKGKTA